MVLCRAQYAKDLDRDGVPGRAGRTADARHRGQGGVLQGSRDAGVCRPTSSRSSPTPGAWPSNLAAAGFRLVSGGTDNHLMLVDVFSKGVTGKVAEAALDKAGITVNKNAIPFDQNPPMVASGIRIGTPAVTTRGMREPEMDVIADFIARVLASPEDDRALRDGQSRSQAVVPEVPPVSRAGRPRRAVDEAFADDGPLARRDRPVRAPRRPAADGARGRRRPRATAASCSPRPAPAPARPWPTSCPRF